MFKKIRINNTNDKISNLHSYHQVDKNCRAFCDLTQYDILFNNLFNCFQKGGGNITCQV